MANIIGVNPPVLNDEDYVDKIKNSLDSVDAHDHSPGKGVAIPAGALAAGSIDNDDINAAAAIARTKLASGTADHVVINSGTGAMSSEAQLAKTRGGTGISSTATFPASGVIVTEAGSQSLSNKTIDADSNTITNIENADIKVGAAIDRTKLASGTINHVVINNGSGVMSSEAALAISRGGTGQATATLGFNALAPTTTAGDFIVHNGTNNVRQGIGSDGQVLVVDTTQTNKLKWTSLQQGAKNYITYNNFENNALTGWNEASVTWTSGAPSGAPTVSATAAASIALSVTSTTPLAGTYSLQMTGTIAQGQGFCTDVLTIDREDQAKVLQGSFFYEVTAGAANANFSGTSSNTLCVYIYDVTNSVWIQPAGVYNLVQSIGQGLCTFTFQTPASISQLRLFVFAANTASGSITVNFDDFALGPQKILSGAAISDWQSYTPTGSWTTNATYSGQWRRVGDSAEVAVSIALSGAPTGQLNNITIPSGIAIDTAKIAGYASNANMVGMGSVKAAGTAYYPIEVMVTSATTLLPAVWSAAGTYVGVDANITATVPGTFANGDFVRFVARFPVSGFSSNTVMSSDTDTRVVAGVMSLASGQTISATTETKVQLNTAEVNTHGTCDITTNYRYSAPVAGVYDISGAVGFQSFTAAEVAIARIKVNGTIVTAATSASPTGTTNVNVVVPPKLVSLNAGDYVELFAQSSADTSYTVGNSATTTFLSVKRLSGPATIAANELVVLCANRITSNQTIAADTETTIIYNQKKIDSHSAYSTSTGIWTCPVAGTYEISANMRIILGATAPSTVGTYFQVDGNTVKLYGRWSTTDLANSKNYTLNPKSIIRLNAGQTVQMRITSSGQALDVPAGGDTESDVSSWYIQRLGF